MTTDLRDQLERLAHDAPPAAAPSDLWTRGVRRQRRTRAVATLAAASLVVAGALVGSLAWDVRRPDPAPVDSSGDAALPDRLSTPDPRTTSTEGDGPLGRLAAIAGAERATSWWSSSANGLVGVSATTGDYRFLDLPGGIDLQGEALNEPALSPDGRLVGYWLNRPGADRLPGFAVYDTTTGQVTRHLEDPEAAPLGVYAESMSWVDEDTLLVTYGIVTERTGESLSGRGIAPRLWTPGEGEPEPLENGPRSMMPPQFVTERGFADVLGDRWREWDGSDGTLLDTTRITRTAATRQAPILQVSPDGRRVAGLDDRTQETSRQLVTGTVEEPRLVQVPTDVRMFDLVGWVDSDHVVARGTLGSDPKVAAVYSIDTRTGEHELLVTEDRMSFGQFPDYADDLFAVPPVTRPTPPEVADPRLMAAGGAGIAVVLVAIGAVIWRRRAQA